MEAVNSVYKEVKKMFQTAVPPYVATVNDDYHYEVWAIKKQAGESQVSEELLGYVAKHEDSVTVGFNNKLGEKIRKDKKRTAAAHLGGCRFARSGTPRRKTGGQKLASK
mgnify:CR=1 FL=1